ncbi:MAG: TonB family protein [Candidatus Aquilonibacter sp.]
MPLILTPMVIADTPTPPPTPVATCVSPTREAQVLVDSQPTYVVQYPITVLVLVTVGPTGNFVDAHILRFSGDIAVDQAALRAARLSQYPPKLMNCEPVMGAVIFRAQFNPRPSPTPSPWP